MLDPLFDGVEFFYHKGKLFKRGVRGGITKQKLPHGISKPPAHAPPPTPPEAKEIERKVDALIQGLYHEKMPMEEKLNWVDEMLKRKTMPLDLEGRKGGEGGKEGRSRG